MSLRYVTQATSGFYLTTSLEITRTHRAINETTINRELLYDVKTCPSCLVTLYLVFKFNYSLQRTIPYDDGTQLSGKAVEFFHKLRPRNS